MRTGKPEHLKGFDYLARHQYFLTFCTDCRKRCFLTTEAVDTARTQIERAAGEQSMALLAYCYMPDHLHLLAEGESDDSDCLRFIARAKQFSGFHYKANLITVCGSDTALSTRFVVRRRLSVWLATFWRIR